MMRKYLKESLHWLHLALFKPITLSADSRRLGEWQAVLVNLKTTPVQLAIILSVALVSLGSEAAGHPFDWEYALFGMIFFGLVLVPAFRVGGWQKGGPVDGVAFGLGGWLETELGVGLMFGLCGRGGGLGVGLISGLVVGLVVGLVFGRGVRPFVRLVVGLSVGVVLVLVLGIAGAATPLRFCAAYAPAFLLAYFRPFHLVPYAMQLWRSKRHADPFPFFQNSPVYWDEAIAMPLPFLSDLLVRLALVDRVRGMNEILNIARLPHQRRNAQRALVTLLVQDFQRVDSFQKMASQSEILTNLASGAEYFPKGLEDVVRHIERVADLARDYLTRVTPVGQMTLLAELRGAIESVYESLYFAMILVRVKPDYGIKTLRWLDIVKTERVRCRKLIAFAHIPNPFVVGNPLMVRDKNLFKGRKDIIVAIEENIINPAQRPALLLYGRRRIGKTSTLLNLPRLLSSQFVPVFIDCQDAKWREGDATFCYHLAASIQNALNQRGLLEKSRRPQLQEFERYAFTRLGEYLDEIEESSRSAHKQVLLTFDEYEKLEDGVSASRVMTEVLNQLRAIVQHRERIVVLFSGSHRFEEMKTINWSDYLINVKTLELSFLAPQDARELITEPVPLLQYEPGVIERIIELTHCQPYLLQAVASDLVNYLNSEKRMLATAADLEVAVEKVLVTVQSFFVYTWTGDCTEPEREVLRMIATGNANSHALADHQASLQSLCHKEILERQASGYRFSIELFRRWILKNQTTQPFAPGDLSEPAELEYTIS